MKNYSEINKYIDKTLSDKGLRIVRITEQVMADRLGQIMDFINGIIREYSSNYGWKEESKDYFLNPLNRKFDFSFLIENCITNEICFISFSSVYENDILHLHLAHSNKNYRGIGLAKYNQLKMCNEAIAQGLLNLDAYWPKQNNGSIILFLKMGWRIDEIRKNGTQLYMKATTHEVLNNLVKMLKLDEN